MIIGINVKLVNLNSDAPDVITAFDFRTNEKPYSAFNMEQTEKALKTFKAYIEDGKYAEMYTVTWD